MVTTSVYICFEDSRVKLNGPATSLAELQKVRVMEGPLAKRVRSSGQVTTLYATCVSRLPTITSTAMSDASTPQPEASSSTQPAAGTQDAAGNANQAHTRREEELARKDRTLAEFMLMLDEYEPLVPAEVTDHYLQQVGFECHDVRLKRLISLAAQKFIADIASDAFQHARIRTNAAPSRLKATGFAGTSAKNDRTRTVLTMDDLSAALGEYGINAKKPDFYL